MHFGNVKLIAHRGNLTGPNPKEENKPCYIREALDKGFDAEIDLWCVNSELYLGHDEPQYKISHDFLLQPRLWIHCKNVFALEYCKSQALSNPYFWHQEDDVTITSNGFFWTYPGKQLTPYSIAVMPETAPFTGIETAYAVCTDYVIRPNNHR